MRRAAILILALCACKTSSEAKSGVQAETSLEKQLYEEVAVAQTLRTGPETDLSLTFAPLPVSPTDAKSVTARPPALLRRPIPVHLTGKPSDLAAILDALPHGPLTGATLTSRAPATSETTLNERTATETHAEGKVEAQAQQEKKSAPSGILGGLASLWPLALLGVLGLAAWIGWGLLKKRLP